MTRRQALPIILLALVALALAACGGGNGKARPTPTPKPIPSPVALAQEPHTGFTLGDPSFEALLGAKADFGQLGGTAYQIEMPDKWNGRLVMYIHGNDQSSTLTVYPPVERDYLIENGFAWASSSFDVNIVYVSGQAADDSTALWDFFVQKYRRPSYTYVMGESMGGAAVITSAERYPDRYDGALAMCGDTFPVDYTVDLFVIGAYAAGLTQQDFDTGEVGQLVTRIRSTLQQDPAKRKLFEDIWIDQTGGPRPFDREGLRMGEPNAWDVFPSNVAARTYGNDGKVYKLGPTAGVSSDDFNQKAVRFKKELDSPYDAGNEVSGDIKIPMISMQSTGDVDTVFSETQELRRKVDTAGKSDLLVQRAIRDPRHCGNRGFTLPEREQALRDLVAWVEDGKKPAGEDLLGDLTNAGKDFTLAPRLGDPAADKIAGADQRVTLHGTLTLDGQPLDGGFLWAMVQKDGLSQPCSFYLLTPAGGQYEMTVAADAEWKGCGAPGAKLYLAYFKDGNRYLSDKTFDWPASKDATFDVAFSSTKPTGAAIELTVDDFFGTGFYGTAFGNDHKPLPVGTVIEAVIGDTVCARYVVPPAPMVFNDQGNYGLNTASPESLPACTKDAPVKFRIDGKDAPETAVNDFAKNGHELILHAP